MKVYKTPALSAVGALFATAALAASLVQTATLKDLQTVGTTSKKQKHQQYDLVFDAGSSEYTCRTKLGSSLKPTQFVVGSTMQFKVDGQKGEGKTSAGDKVNCAIVRVAAVPAPGRNTQ